MSKPLSRKYVYESDDGFVEDAPKSKKRKNEPRPRNTTMQKDEEGNEYWELSGKRRVQISEFKNNTMVGIREFYEQNGKMLPGKKGISMTVEQYTAFLELVPEIERALHSKGIKVPRPQFDHAPSSGHEGREEGSDEEHDEGVDEADANGGAKSSKKQQVALGRTKSKRNHEATSDEDEG